MVKGQRRQFGQGKPLRPVGIIASDDIVAVDQATLDVMNRELGKDLFREFRPEMDYTAQVKYGASIGLGSPEYELVEIDR